MPDIPLMVAAGYRRVMSIEEARARALAFANEHLGEQAAGIYGRAPRSAAPNEMKTAPEDATVKTGSEYVRERNLNVLAKEMEKAEQGYDYVIPSMDIEPRRAEDLLKLRMMIAAAQAAQAQRDNQ